MAKTYSCILIGLEIIEVEIECFVGAGFSGLHILGLRTDAARDMRERIRSALESIGIPVPAKRIVVNLSAYELFRLSRSPVQELDFAVAASIIIALFNDQKIHLPIREKEYFAGELTLMAGLKPVQNALIYEKMLYEDNFEGHFSISCSQFANNKTNFDVYQTLLEWLNERKNHVTHVKQDFSHSDVILCSEMQKSVPQLAKEILELKKSPKICVALLIAAAGRHHLLLGGEPGIGKTYSIHKIRSFLRPMKFSEAIELQLIYAQKTMPHSRPFRSPHHTSSAAALVGGHTLKPGEATLAHRGVLFLDEIAEFARNALEVLREPLDSGRIELARSAGSVSYPAEFLLCATTNPCPCGYLFSYTKPCRCLPHIGKKYLSQISGPLIDRFDLKLWVSHPNESFVQSSDIFSNYIFTLENEELIKFCEHFIKIQSREESVKNNFEIDDQHTFDMSKPMNDSQQCFKEKLSMRGQYQMSRLENTFKKVFPMLADKNNFTNDIFAYRNFSQLLESDLTG